MISPSNPAGNIGSRRYTVRAWGIGLVVLILSAGVAGVASAGQGLTGPTPLLGIHLALGAVVVGSASWALCFARRTPGTYAHAATLFTGAAVWATALTGGAFLLTGFRGGEAVDRILALISLSGAILMVAADRGSREKLGSTMGSTGR